MRTPSVVSLRGDCIEAMRVLAAEGVTVDAIVTDPPYGIGFMGRDWDSFAATHKTASNNKPGGWNWGGAPGAVSKRFYEGGAAFQAWNEEWARAALALLPPGGHLLAFGGTRTYHRLVCAIEDAGFEIRDTVSWIYGSGFPKSHNVSKGIDKAAGADGKWVAQDHPGRPGVRKKRDAIIGQNNRATTDNPDGLRHIYAPATAAARQWDGWGTALKPACELIVLARKPLIGTVAANVLQHGTGALNIDGCRVEGGESTVRPINNIRVHGGPDGTYVGHRGNRPCDGRLGGSTAGRWPANLVHDGSEEVLRAFGAFGERGGQLGGQNRDTSKNRNRPSGFGMTGGAGATTDTGSAARFYYCCKATKKERDGSKHPTVKPINLLRWLARLITPPGGVILDPFAGSGTLGEAALAEGFDAILIEREEEYLADISRRLARLRETA